MSVTIGIDPHKSTHTAVAVDRDGTSDQSVPGPTTTIIPPGPAVDSGITRRAHQHPNIRS